MNGRKRRKREGGSERESEGARAACPPSQAESNTQMHYKVQRSCRRELITLTTHISTNVGGSISLTMAETHILTGKLDDDDKIHAAIVELIGKWKTVKYPFSK